MREPNQAATSMRRSVPTGCLLLAFLAGAACGGLLVASLAERASGLYLQMTRMTLASEQERRASQALRSGALAAAMNHASCGVILEEGPEALKPSRSAWHLTFPAMGAFVTERTTYPVQDNTRLLALAHAKLAVVWERGGDQQRAAQEYETAVRLAGDGDVIKWREAARAALGAQ